jgi:predicted phage tail protein
MATSYKFIRMQKEVYDIYAGIKVKMETDLTKRFGQPFKLNMNNVMRAVASPKFNENYIKVDLNTLKRTAKRAR